MATDTPTLTEATEPMDTGTPMLIMVSTTERDLLRLSPRPRLRLTPGWLMVMLATPTLMATEPMELTPMLIMATTTARGLLMLSLRPRLRLTPGWLMVMLATLMPTLVSITDMLDITLVTLMPTTARGLPMLSPRLRLMLMLTTATPGPTPMDTDTVLATEATTGDKFSPLSSANKAEAQSEHHTLLSDLISFSAPLFEVQEIDLSS